MLSRLLRLSKLQANIGKITVMRHGETNYNFPRKRLQGMSPSDKIFVSEKGKQEATSKLASIKLPPILISSPLLRCKQTAEAWANVPFDKIKSEKILMNGLKEIDVGELEDAYVDELPKHDKYRHIWQSWKKDPLHFTGFPGGETLPDFQHRVLTAFSDACHQSTKNPSQDICVVTHGGPIRILKCFLENKDLSHLWEGEEVHNLERLELTPDQIMRLKNYTTNTVTTTLRSNIQSSEDKIQYYKGLYEPNHWAMRTPSPDDKFFITTLKINSVDIVLTLNPKDARGYRGIARLMPKKELTMDTTFNREYTEAEDFALNTALAIFARVYKNFKIIAQVSIAGNNSQSVDANGITLIGNKEEPSLLHGHLIGRGDPNKAYIPGVKTKLNGPKAGKEVNLRGDGPDEGNTTKIKWNENEMELVASAFAQEVVKVLKSSAEFKKVKIVDIHNNVSKELLSTSCGTYKRFIGAAAASVAVGVAGFFAYRSDSLEAAAASAPAPGARLKSP